MPKPPKKSKGKKKDAEGDTDMTFIEKNLDEEMAAILNGDKAKIKAKGDGQSKHDKESSNFDIDQMAQRREE